MYVAKKYKSFGHQSPKTIPFFWVVVVASEAKGHYHVTCSRGRNCRNEEDQWFGFRSLSFQVDAFKSIFDVSEKKIVLSPTWPLVPASKR